MSFIRLRKDEDVLTGIYNTISRKMYYHREMNRKKDGEKTAMARI